jgi:hypothetical protein
VRFRAPLHVCYELKPTTMSKLILVASFLLYCECCTRRIVVVRYTIQREIRMHPHAADRFAVPVSEEVFGGVGGSMLAWTSIIIRRAR